MSNILISLTTLLALALPASSGQQQENTPLQEVGDLIVGEWTGEGIWAADYPGFGKKGDRFTGTETCRWLVGQAAIGCEGAAGGSAWTSLFWWDPVAKQIMTVGVNSGGNHDKGTIMKQGAKLVWESSGSFADGQLVQFKGETIFEDNGNTKIQVGATILDGVRNEFRDIYKRVGN